MSSGVSIGEPSTHHQTSANQMISGSNLLHSSSLTSALVSGLTEKLNSHRLSQQLDRRGVSKVCVCANLCLGVFACMRACVRVCMCVSVCNLFSAAVFSVNVPKSFGVCPVIGKH